MNYRNTFNGFVTIVRTEGLLALYFFPSLFFFGCPLKTIRYNGIGPSLVGNGVSWGLHFFLYVVDTSSSISIQDVMAFRRYNKIKRKISEVRGGEHAIHYLSAAFIAGKTLH